MTVQPSIHNDFLHDLCATVTANHELIALALRNEDDKIIESLVSQPTVYTDTGQKERRIDRVLVAEITHDKKRDKKLFLLEFKADQSSRLFLQLLSYLVLLYKKYRCAVIMVVIYSGKRKVWHLPSSLREYLHKVNTNYVTFLEDMTLNYRYLLVNLHNIDIKTLLRQAPTIGAGLFVARQIHELQDADIEAFYWMCLELPILLREELVEKVAVYITKFMPNRYDWDRLVAIESKCLPAGDRIMKRMKFSRAGAVAEALEQGLEKGREEVVLRLLKSGLDDETVCISARLTKKELARIKQKLAQER